jgi:hypothetical protein
MVNTASLFRNLPDPGKTPIKAMTLEELMSSSKINTYNVWCIMY